MKPLHFALAFGMLSVLTISGQNNWALFNNNNSASCTNYVDLGNISVSGTQLTVEANIYILPNGQCNSSPYHDVVSKHYDNQNVNYLMRPDHAEINTTTGFKATPPITISSNECHHIAMVYDGTWLKFYVDSLADSVACTGNMITNSLNTFIGYSSGMNPNWYTQYFGYVDEVRIWNVARTRAQIDTYAFTNLPNPTSQPGLLAYYSFEGNYNNVQGNSAYNGNPTGNVSIALNPSSTCVENVGMDELVALHTFTLTPNPSDGMFKLNSEGNLQSAVLTIYDVMGQEVKTISGISDSQVLVDAGELPAGTYLIVVREETMVLGRSTLVILR